MNEGSLIPLGPFVRALAQKSYEEFGIVKDQLQNDVKRANRDKLLEFLPNARHKLIRFLVLVRYLKQNHTRIKTLEKIHSIIIKSEHQYGTACQNFDELYTEMVTTMEAPWDIETAIHVLTLGSYRNLPKIIENSVIDDLNGCNINKALSSEFVTSTIDRLNNELRVRLLSDSIPPELKLLNINKGMVFMIANNQFKVAISLRMRPKLINDNENEIENERVRWSLFELNLLLKASINKKINEAEVIVTDIETNALLLTVNEKMKLSKYPLQIMYKELNIFCLKLQFAVLMRQLHCIGYIYGDNNIRIETEQLKSITIRMWKYAANLPNDSYNIIDNTYNYNNNNHQNVLKEIQQKQKQQQQQWLQQQQQLQLQSKTNYSKKSKSILGSTSYRDTNTNFNMEGLDEFERKQNEIKSQFRISLTILYEEEGLDIVYRPKLPSFITEEIDEHDSDHDDDDDDDDDYKESLDGGIKNLLSVNPNNLNLPKLIENFTILHCNYRLLYLLNKLIEINKEYAITPTVKAINSETQRKKILFSTKGDESSVLTQKDKIKIMRNLQCKYIEICLYDEKYIEIYVNSNNGEIVLEKSYHELISTAPLLFEKNLKRYNDEMNGDLSKISNIVKKLKIDCLLENIRDLAQNELNLDVISYAPCNKPNKYFVYPSLLIHKRNVLQLKKRKKNVTIQENDDYQRDIKEQQTITIIYTEILKGWNENNSVFIRIPPFGKHCYLTLYFKSQKTVEMYCIINDHFGNLLYIHNIPGDFIKVEREYYLGVIQISPQFIHECIAYCINLLPQHLIKIMISSHIQTSISDLKWNLDKEDTKCLSFDMIFPRPSTTANLMHTIPRKFQFDVFLYKKKTESSFSWKCLVKQDTIFSKHKDSLLSKLNKIFKFEANCLVFQYENNINIGQFTEICNYCYKLLVVYNILRGFIDHKQAIKQNSAFYQKKFYKLKRIDLIAPCTNIEIEFSLFDKNEIGYDTKTYIIKFEIIWNNIENVKYYNDEEFNPYINNTDYSIKISFCHLFGNQTLMIYQLIPNLKLLISYYFDYRKKYHMKLKNLLRKLSSYGNDKDIPFDPHDTMLKFKDFIGRTQNQNINTAINAKQQSYIYAQYESLSFMMFLQKLYWSIKTLNYINPFIQCLNCMHKWFYPQSPLFIQLKVTRYDTLRIIIPFYSSDTDNILAIRILNENKVCLHQMDVEKGWQLNLEEIEFINISNKLLKLIQTDLLTPRKHKFLSTLFANINNNKIEKNIYNDLIEMPLQNVMFSCLNEKHKKQIFNLLFYSNDGNAAKLGLKQPPNDKELRNSQTLYAFQPTITHYFNNFYPKHINKNDKNDKTENGKSTTNINELQIASTNNIKFINDVIKAYFYLYGDMKNGYSLYHEMKIQGFLSAIFSCLMYFVAMNNKSSRQQKQENRMLMVAKPLLFVQEICALYYDEIVQLSLFGGKVLEIVGTSYLRNTNLYCPVELTSAHNIKFWYNLHHINDIDIILDEKALCVQVHFAEICDKKEIKSSLHFYSMQRNEYKMASPSATVTLSATPSPSPSKSASKSPSPPRIRGRGRRNRRGRGGRSKKRGGKFRNSSTRKYQANGYHHQQINGTIDGEIDELWIFEKYKLKNHVFLNIAIDLDEETDDFGTIFFYHNMNRKNNPYRKMSIGFLPNLNKLVLSINLRLKQNGYLGSLIVSFLRQFVIKLSQIKRNDEKQFNEIWKELKRLNN